MFEDRMFRTARKWSNQELRKLAPIFTGEVVNVSAWDDRDKEDAVYSDYFTSASGYYCTNFAGHRGYQNQENEFALDLTIDQLPAELRHRFDVAFNHTTLEHIFDISTAFRNLCEMSRDVVVVVVPFAQVQHESDSYKDYWRFTPSCLRILFQENGLEVIYESESLQHHSAVYLLFVGSRHPERWQNKLPAYNPIENAANWIGRRRFASAVRSLFRGNFSAFFRELKRAA